MCRLVAYLGEPWPVDRALVGGSHSLLRQSFRPRELLHGSVNADGWGAVWYPDEHPVRLARPEPAWYDPEARTVLAAQRAPLVLAAVRNATPGLPVDRAGLLPVVHGRWSFVLNGFVPRFRTEHMRALRAGLPDDLYAELLGASDAETLFLLAVAGLRSGQGVAEVLERLAATVLERLADDQETPLTMVLADGTTVGVCHTSNGERVNSLYLLSRGGLAPEGVLLASEALDEHGGWKSVPAHTLLEIDRNGAHARPLDR